MALDTNLFYFLNSFAGRFQFLDAFIIFIAAYLQYFVVVLAFLFLYLSDYSKRKKLRLFLMAAASVIIARLLAVEVIRFLYHSPRPFAVLETNKLLSSGWFYSDAEWSFPSGHAAFFFALATTIYLYNKKWGLVFFVLSAIIAISRIAAGVHYPSDILGGAAVGIIVACLIFYFLKKRGWS